MLTKSRYDAPLKIKAVSDSGEFTAYGSVFGVEDSHGDVVVKGAFEKSLKAMKEKGRLPALLWQHKMSEPIGVYTKVEEDDHGLYTEGRLLIDDDPLAKRAHAHMKAGSVSGMSIGYYLNDYEYDKEKAVFILKEIDLIEVSLVTVPSNDDARVQDVKNALKKGEMPSPKALERLLRDVGFTQKAAKTFMSRGYSALNNRDDYEDAGKKTARAANRDVINLIDKYFS